MDMHADENGRALSEAAFEVAQWIILAAYIDDDINDRISFRLVAAPRFIATITPIGPRFDVKVSTGAVSAIVDVIARVAATNPIDDFISADSLRELGINDEETAWDFVFVAAMVFLALHEAGHCVAGHLSLMTGPTTRQKKLSFSENERSIITALAGAANDTSLTSLDISRMMELEADGMAADLIYSDFLEILATFEDHIPSGSPPSATCRLELIRLCTLAMTIVLGLIELYRLESMRSGPSLHPLPLGRMLNIVGRRLQMLQRNTLHRNEDDAAIVVDIDEPEEVIDIARDAFWLMMVVDKALGKPVFNSLSDELVTATESGFISDLQAYMSGSPPNRTDAGTEFSELASRAGPYLRHLKTFRLCDFWQLQDGK
ncbi:hypothetical protein SAMN05880590_12813 [Rhizobium sp. RU35A]|uniref:hypothetical protein n=1 Tax=Rhizobium sp. RU35A TaxID=1907414 RepID=UPI0009547950|nr:hypothetical protein [Rhizobium sp. RU35A]SIR41958.1 hypothetical protein SAMN05880590_12813 [Rhizobium sp. RU35A]